MNPSADSETKLLLEVPYEPNLWVMVAVVITASVCEYGAFLIFTHDSSGPPAVRGLVACIAAFIAFPLVACGATLMVTSLVRRTLKLTTTEISAPSSGFALQNTVVQLRDIKRVSVRPTANRRYLDIYHSAGRLGIAESWLPSAEVFEEVLTVVGRVR